MRRRPLLLGLGGLVALAGAGTTGLVVGRDDGGPAPTASAAQAHRSTARLTVRDLEETTDASGTIGFSASRALALATPGTVTALPEAGTTVDRGGELAEVDGAPVLLLFGRRPAWRPIGPGTDGPDVEQLEANLIALGYGTAGTLGPNTYYSEATQTAIERWQKAVGLPQTGVIELGRVVFQPGALRITKHLAEAGAPSTGPVLQVADTTRSVHVDLGAADQSIAHEGDAVQVELPDGSTVAGTITSVGTVSAGSGDSGATLPLEIALTDPDAAKDLDGAPVTVHLTTSAAKHVLAAPVTALLALAEGGYAVEEVTGPTTTHLAAVKLGPSADGWVQVTGAVHEGDEVVVAP